MGFCSQFNALFKKNCILWYRNLSGSLCEIIFPVILMFVIVAVRFLVQDVQHPSVSYINNTKDSYYIDSTVKTMPSNMAAQSSATDGLYPNNPFLSCINFKRPLIAYVGSHDLYSKVRSTLFSNGGTFSVLNNASSTFFKERTFSSEADLENYVTAIDYDTPQNPGVCVGIIIEGSSWNYKVKLRYDDNTYESAATGTPKQQIPTTRFPIVNSLVRTPDYKSYTLYKTSGFAFLEYVISQEILRLDDPLANLKMGVIPIKTPDYVEDVFLSSAGTFLAFIMVLCYLAPVFRIVSIVVQEKELKTREGMKMMGLKDSAYWLSFFTYYFIIFVIIAVLLASIAIGFVFKHSDWFITFLFFLLYGLSIFSFGLLMSSLFNRARVASITGTMLYFASYIVMSLVQDPTIAEISKNVACLLPTVAVSMGSLALVNYESGQYGVNFDNASELSNNYRFSTALYMLFIDFVIYGVIGLYLENVLPSPTGVRQPLHFFLTKEFWTGQSTENEDPRAPDRVGVLAAKSEKDLLYPDKKFFNPVGPELEAQETSDQCLKIRNLNKFFGTKHAVNEFSVNMYKNQIFALLGPNGAGKTTTLSMLTGLLPASNGSAFFSGLAMFKQMAKTREKLGVCPQHDVLFERLTPKEHLEIFAAFKGRSDTEAIKKDVDEIMKDIELKDVEDQLACNLSGGQRRKLSIGISFIGNSDMIFLDEPTSGIDIATRKKVWVMLKKYKANKVIILTTHYMEEAEELGDRIGIMSNGTLRCVGEPLFLKEAFEIGYNLVIVKEEMPHEEDEKIQDEICKFLDTYVGKAKIRRAAGREVTFLLPKEKSKQFKQMFIDLDNNREKLKIQSYGMTTSTLEEIFLKVAQESENPDGQALKDKMRSDSMKVKTKRSELDDYTIATEPELGTCAKFSAHFFAILIKRLIITARNWTTMVNELFVPIILIVFGFALTKIPTFFDGNERFFVDNVYNTPQSLWINNAGIYGEFSSVDLTKYFDKTYFTTKNYVPTSTDLLTNFKEYDSILFNDRGVSPYRYGSVYVKTLSKVSHTYEFYAFVNISSQDATGAYLSYVSQAVLRLATGKSNLKLTFANYPLPLTYQTRHREEAKNGNIVSNTLVVAFALVPASVVSFIVKEREDNLKHQQLISGVALAAYWLANAAMDVIKSLVPCSISIGLIYAFSVDLSIAWSFILVFAFTIIPFTYATSFFFKAENNAQSLTLMLHFFTGVVLSPVFTILHLFENTRSAGIILGWIIRIVPSFSLAYGINNIS